MDWSGIDRLQALGQRAAAVRELERRRQIDNEALRMSIAAQREAEAASSGLVAQALQAGGSPEMKAAYNLEISGVRDPILARGDQNMQRYLVNSMAPAPSRGGLGGALERFFSTPVPREYSEYQKGLLANTLAGEQGSTIAGEQRSPLDYRAPEERMKSEYTRSQIEANKGLAQYRASGYGRGRNIVVDTEGNYRILSPGEQPELGERPVNPGQDRTINPAQITEAMATREHQLTQKWSAEGKTPAEIKEGLDKDDLLQGLESQLRESIGKGKPVPTGIPTPENAPVGDTTPADSNYPAAGTTYDMAQRPEIATTPTVSAPLDIPAGLEGMWPMLSPEEQDTATRYLAASKDDDDRNNRLRNILAKLR